MELPHRKHIRSRIHDYSQPGNYFVTINVRLGKCLLGKASPDKIILNELGQVTQEYWQSIPIHFSNICLDEYIVMPNHIHGIISIQKDCDSLINEINEPNEEETFDYDSLIFQKSPDLIIPSNANKNSQPNHFGAQKRGSLGIIVGQFKAAVTRYACKNGYGNLFDWQPRFYDQIIRNNSEMDYIRLYIRNNPIRWWSKYGDENF